MGDNRSLVPKGAILSLCFWLLYLPVEETGLQGSLSRSPHRQQRQGAFLSPGDQHTALFTMGVTHTALNSAFSFLSNCVPSKEAAESAESVPKCRKSKCCSTVYYTNSPGTPSYHSEWSSWQSQLIPRSMTMPSALSALLNLFDKNPERLVLQNFLCRWRDGVRTGWGKRPRLVSVRRF